MYILQSHIIMEQLLVERCIDLILKINLHSSNAYAAVPLMRYILSIPYALPISTIILAERPYATNIFPYAASAMSYSSKLQKGVTPVVHYLALDISNGSELSFYQCADWFRDSWKYLRHGIILLNVCTSHMFMENESERERVAMEEFIRDMIIISLKLVNDVKHKVHIYALGNPAQHSAGRIKSSVFMGKDKVIIHKCVNPAQFKHRLGDTKSPEFTMGYSSITRGLSNIIRSTINSNDICTLTDYLNMSNGKDIHSRIINTSNDLKSVFGDIAKYFKTDPSGRGHLADAQLFERGCDCMTNFIAAMNTTTVKVQLSRIEEPSEGSKPAYFSRSNVNQTKYKKGFATSSRASTTQQSSSKISIGFIDDDDSPAEAVPVPTPVISLDTRADSTEISAIITPQTPTPARIAAARSVSGRSITGGHSNVGFIDDVEEEDEEDDEDSNIGIVAANSSIPDDFDNRITDIEKEEFSYVSDFIDPSSSQYNVASHIREFINSAIRSGKADSQTSREVLKIIRDSNQRDESMYKLLGFEDNIVDMSSDILNWVLNKCVS